MSRWDGADVSAPYEATLRLSGIATACPFLFSFAFYHKFAAKATFTKILFAIADILA